MRLSLSLFLVVAFVPLLVRAELLPSAYESMQTKASEYIRMEVMRVNVAPGKDPAQQEVHVIAMVNEVIRTSTSMTPDEILNIHYTITVHPEGWVGPGELPLLREKMTTIAYLNKLESGDYEPAAGRMSFTNF